MLDILTHPAAQAGLLPFFAALIISELFLRVRLSGLALIAGFSLTVFLVSDFGLEPLTATRKIVWLGLTSALLGLLLGSTLSSWRSWILPVLAAAVTGWTLQRILEQQPPETLIRWGASCAAYVAILVWGMDKLLEQETPRASSAATALGIGTGGAALLGGSALLGQFGLAIGAAAGAHLLIQLISNQSLPTGRMFTLPAALLSGLIGCLAALSAKLPWYALAILACIPLALWLTPLPKKQSIRPQGMLLALLALTFSAGAIYLTWRMAGDVPL
jgi:hypothetical protein